MKRCNACGNKFPDSYTTCPDCGKLLSTITEEDLAKEAEEKQRLEDIKRQRLATLREQNRGAGALTTLGIFCAVLDVIMIALFVATANFGGAILCVAALLCAVLGVIFLKKPELISRMSSSHSEKKDPVDTYQQFKTAAIVLVLIALALTAVQIGMQVSSFLEILSSAEAL